MRIAQIAPEVHPFSKTGGLGDVLGALPPALAAEGAEVVVVTPRYRGIKAEPTPLRVKTAVAGRPMEAAVLKAALPGSQVPVYFLDAPEFFDREHCYGAPGQDYQDNAARFAFLSRGALELLRLLGPAPDVVHAHDWQTGLVPVYLKTLYATSFPRVRSVLTVHNLAYQGLFPQTDFAATGLDWSLFNWRQAEFYGQVGYLKAGLVFADRITTVSPTYAKEIQEPELGSGLDGVLRERSTRLQGILNGIDAREWNPEEDPHLPARFSADDLAGKAVCRQEVLKRFGLPEMPGALLLAFIGRLVGQKGADLLVDAAESFLGANAQMVVLGTGDPRMQERLERLAVAQPGRVAVRFGFDHALAHLIEAGADAFLMPSRFEPCGLNQMYSQRYGTLPIVRKTGGLADTVVNAGPKNLKARTATGFVFEEPSAAALGKAVRQALGLFAKPAEWREVMRTAMRRDFSWRPSALQYLNLYQSR